MSELPQGWVNAPLDDIAIVNPGRIDGLSTDMNVSFVPMPAVSDGEIVGPTVRPFAEVSKGYTQFQEGDVIFAKITPCMENGKIAVVRSLENGVACGSTEFHVVRPRGENSPDYIWRFLRQKRYRDDAEASMTGAVGQRRVPAAHLKESRLPLPPVPEQRRIVAKIDSLTGKSKRARDHLDHLPRLVEKYKQAVLAAAFRGQLTGSSTSFSRRGLRSITSRITKGASPNWQGFKYLNEGVLFVRSQNVGWGKLLFEEQAFLPPTFNLKQRNSVIAENDVLLNIVGASIGRTAVATAKLAGANCNQAVSVIRLAESNYLDARYVNLWLQSDQAQNAITLGSVDVARANFSLGSIGELQLPWPDETTRQQTVNRIETAFAWIDRLTSKATSAGKSIDRLDQAILVKAFRGELVPQDPNDEPASVLLERIRAERADAPQTKRGRRTKEKA